MFRESLSVIKEELKEKEEYENLEYEPEKVRQRKSTFEPLEEARRELEKALEKVQSALSLFQEDRDEIHGYLNSARKILQALSTGKKSAEDAIYVSLAKSASNGKGEEIREYPWVKKLLESREKGPDPRVKHIKNAYTRLHIQNFKENPTEPDGKVASLAKQLLSKTEEKEITQSLEFYLSVGLEETPKSDRKIYEKPRTFGKFFSYFAQIREHMRTLQSEPPEVGELTRWYVDEIWEGNPPEDHALIRECWKELIAGSKNKSQDPVKFLKEVYQWWKEADETEIDPKQRWIIQGDTTRGLKSFRGKFLHIISARQGSSRWSFKDADYTLPEDWVREEE